MIVTICLTTNPLNNLVYPAAQDYCKNKKNKVVMPVIALKSQGTQNTNKSLLKWLIYPVTPQFNPMHKNPGKGIFSELNLMTEKEHLLVTGNQEM